MANQIKLKRGSGSDPSASDLVLGELAIRTDTGKLFTKKDDNSVAEISGGGISDGDKGDITVSNSGATFTIDDDAVTYAKIQNVSATNRILGRDSSGAGAIEEITPANLRTMINVEDGATADQSASDILSLLSDQNIATTGSLTIGTDIIHSGDTDTKISFDTDQVVAQTGGTPRLTITDSAIQLSLNTQVAGTFRMSHTNGNFAVNNGAGTDVFTVNSSSGNVTTSGTVDGRDLATDGSKLDGIESGATADQSNSEIKTAYEANSNTNAFTDALLSKLNGIAASATNVTNNNQLTNGAGYITSTLTEEQVEDFVGGMVTGNTETGITVTYQDSDGTLDFVVASQTDNNFTDTLKNKLDGIASGATNVTNTNQLTNGAGFITSADGGNAATLDGIDSSQFLRSDASDTLSEVLTLSKDTTDVVNFSANSTNDNRGIAFNGRTAISADYNDGFLRINNASEFSNGVYTPTVLRADGGFQVNANTVINSSGNLIASRLTGALPAIDGSSLTGISAGATGGGSDEVFYENDQTVTTNYTITNGKNAMAAGPITINSGVTVTVGSGETLTIV